ncbi:MAG TPA: hypothetical protein VIW24_10840 [Aldersonia sp.]
MGSCWQPNASYIAQLPDDNAAKVPDGVRREAYSWGGIARTTPGAPGTGVASVVVNVLGRIGWALLLPFGLANVGTGAADCPATRRGTRRRRTTAREEEGRPAEQSNGVGRQSA